MKPLKVLKWTILIIACFGIWYTFYFTNKPCTSPITYTLGTFDTGFGISKTEFLSTIHEATSVWNKAAGKELFKEDPHGALVINLIYDNRQKTTQKNVVLKANVTKVGELAQATKSQYQSLEAELTTLEQSYKDELATFNQNESNYTSTVTYWNSHGGAPKNEYDTLTIEQQNLEREQTSLEEKVLEINTLVSQVNDFIKKYNLLVDSTNVDINTINQSAGKEFEEGLYDPNTNTITIYEFSSSQKLTRVLIHELGHALGLDHNNNPKSVMYPINQGNTLTLSKEDLEALKIRCSLP